MFPIINLIALNSSSPSTSYSRYSCCFAFNLLRYTLGRLALGALSFPPEKEGLIYVKLVELEQLQLELQSTPESKRSRVPGKSKLYGTPFVTKIHLVLGVLLAYKDFF